MIVELSHDARKAIERFDTPTKKRIREALERLPSGDVKKLAGFSSAYRLRVGDLRVLFDMTRDMIYVNDILPRGKAYKRR